MFKSELTFDQEMESVGGIPGLLWDRPAEYSAATNPFASILNKGEAADDADLLDPGYSPVLPKDIAWIPQTDHVWVRRPNALEDILQGGDSNLAERFYDAVGLDLNAIRKAASERVSNSRELAALTHQFGMEAYGQYLPWHAFARSHETSWGIYILPLRIGEWTEFLLRTSRHLPEPKPSWDKLFMALLWVVYRHELFHWHVETFALEHEVLVRRPVYRPYVEKVRVPISRNNPSQWWEEALAQAVVLDSKLVSRRSGFTLRTLRRFLIPDFRTRFGDGYRHFECTSVGGVQEAHRILSAQVARTQIEHDPRSTDLALIKDRYGLNDKRVPGYLCLRAADFMRLQLAPVKERLFDRYFRARGARFSPGPGDHRILEFNGDRIHVNAHGDEVDLASLKAAAKMVGMSVFKMAEQIRVA